MIQGEPMAKTKKSLSSMDIAALELEFQSLIGTYIKKAYQPEREVVVLRLNTGEGKRDLVIRTGRAIYLSSKGPDNPPQPTGFAMLLRKHLTNGRIVSVEQQEFDRILIFGIQKEERYDLVVEGFGDGNIILVKDGNIIQPLISRTWRHRTVRAGREYEVPPAMVNPRTMLREEFDGILNSSEKDIVRTLAMGINLGGSYAEEVCLISGIGKGMSCEELGSSERDSIWENIGELFRKLKKPEPVIVREKMGEEVEEGDKEEFVVGNEKKVEGEVNERGKNKGKGEEKDDVIEEEKVIDDKKGVGGEVNEGDEEEDGVEDKGVNREKETGNREGNEMKTENGDGNENENEGKVKLGKVVNILPFPLRIYDEYEIQRVAHFNDAVEEYFSQVASGKDDGGAGGEGEGRTSAEVNRIQRTIEQQEQTILKLEQSIIDDKERAERIFLRYSEFEKVLNDIKGYGEKHGWPEMAEALGGNPKVLQVETAKKFVILRDEPTNIRLDYLKSINENAQRYYEAANRAREKMTGAQKALEESRLLLEMTKKHDIKVRERTRIERKHFWFEKYRWFISSDGNIIVGGKDAFTNDRVVKKYLKERDRYAHAEIHGAPSLVIKSIQNQEMSEQTLKEACIYAACFSRAWRAGIGGVQAYWVLPDQVSKTPAAGEFIAKGAFIIRGRRNRIHADLRLGIGKVLYEGTEMIMCGPVSTIEAYSNTYLIIEPGDIPKNDFARQLSRVFNVKNEEILSILPGDVRVITQKGLDWKDETQND